MPLCPPRPTIGQADRAAAGQGLAVQAVDTEWATRRLARQSTLALTLSTTGFSCSLVLSVQGTVRKAATA